MKIKWFIGALIAVALAAPVAHSQAGKAKEETFTDPDKAGPDWKTQGEYEGRIAGGEKLAAQVVAKGDGKFDVCFLTGGLPGAGWDGKTRVQIPAMSTPAGGATTVTLTAGANPNRRNPFDATISAGTVMGKTADGKEFTLKQVVRHSPTEGAKPPADGVVLFDGTNTDQWVSGKLIESNLLRWGTHSKKAFQDFKAHLEFRLPFKPKARGQERGNSGIKLQQRYEIQVLDSFGLKGDKHECGSVYTQTAPSVNMCFPPLSWQTYDLDFKATRYDAAGKKTANASVTVVQNGVKVLDNVAIPAKTGASKPEGPQPGPLELQDHGNPVVYRNIWVVEPK